jgi:lysozyme
MPVNAATLEHIKRWEGLRLTAYPDPGSATGEPWTIGYGHTGPDVSKGLTITAVQAEQWLVEDLDEAEAAVDDLVKVALNDNQRGALVSFVFNVGAKAFEESTLLRKLNDGEYSSVPSQFMRWVHNDKVRMPGLVKRRQAEGALWNAPVTPPAIPEPQFPEPPKPWWQKAWSWVTNLFNR